MRMESMCAALLAAMMMLSFSTNVLAVSRDADRNRSLREQPEKTPLVRESFTHAVTLDGQGGTVLSYILPEHVHKGFRHPSFDDLCVFDAEGNPVPFLLRSSAQSAETRTILKDVPHFVWQPEKADAGAPASMDIEINTKGDIVRIKGQGEIRPQAGPISYIVDMRDFLDAIETSLSGTGNIAFGAGDIKERSLTVRMVGETSFMTTVVIKTSADLAHWKNLGPSQVLAHMRQGDLTLERDTLTLPSRCERYLLLSFSDGEAVARSFQASAVFDKTTEEVRETRVPGTLSSDKRSVAYELPGRFPIVSVSFDVPQADMMAVHLRSTDDPARPFFHVAKGFVYRLEKDGIAITGDSFPVTHSRHYWSLLALGDIPFASAPVMRVHWKPMELLFLARGKGPWTLAYGGTRSVATLALPMLNSADSEPAKEIAVSPSIETVAAQPLSVTEGTSQWLLWSALALAVVFLTGITVWLARSMRR